MIMASVSIICEKNEAEKYRQGINMNIRRSNRTVAIIPMMMLKMGQQNIGGTQESKRRIKAKVPTKRKLKITQRRKMMTIEA